MKKPAYLKQNTGGFTLIEVVVVMAILTVLMGVAVPSLLAYARHGKETERAGQEEVASRALRQYFAFEGSFPNLDDLDPADGERELSADQAAQLKNMLLGVTSVRININDYIYTYNEQTGVCGLARR